MNESFPYTFKNRPVPEKTPLQYLHHRLDEDNIDIAFEVQWTALTPLALNPVVEPSLPDCIPNDQGSPPYYSGYNRRWLLIDGHPAISTFTVKSALSNAYGNLMGGCYRVNTIVEPHRDLEKGIYPYTGRFKRYRVAMDGSSRPGIIKEIRILHDNAREVTIQPVEEYYSDEDLPRPLKRGEKTRVKKVKSRGHKPPIVKVVNSHGRDTIEVFYHGPYHYGMNLTDPHGRKHKHRFYREKGRVFKGIIRQENFWSLEDLKRIVYMGGRDQNNKPINLWYQDLRDLKEGDFVYFEVFNGRVSHIGKNFLFKALFAHDDTIPPGQEPCKGPGLVCPRCSLFGLTFTEEDTHGGFRGRVKTENLVSPISLREDWTTYTEPLKGEPVKVLLLKDASGRPVGKQLLLPVLGPPKPNKRDVNGYYDKTTGYLKGAKVYRHADLRMDSLERLLESLKGKKIQIGDKEIDYNHNLRNWAVVLSEGVQFCGIIGAENCTLEEAAALAFLLHSPYSDHGYKLGLAKAVGLGTVSSSIIRIYIRQHDTYQWKAFEVDDLLKTLKNHYPALAEEVQKLKKAARALNLLEEKYPTLEYPPAGLRYWKMVRNG